MTVDPGGTYAAVIVDDKLDAEMQEFYDSFTVNPRTLLPKLLPRKKQVIHQNWPLLRGN